MSIESDLPPVSILINTKDRPNQLKRLLASLASTDYPQERRHIVVVEETATPQQPAEPTIAYHHMPPTNKGFGYARNHSWQLAYDDIIVFVDDDCLVTKNWLRELVLPLVEYPEVAAVGGAVLVPPCGAIGQAENVLGFPAGGIKYIHESEWNITQRPTFSTCNCAIRKKFISEAGGFEEELRYGGEDETLSRKIAISAPILYNPTAVVYHQPRASLLKNFRWFVRRGRAEADMFRKTTTERSFRIKRLIARSPLARILLVIFLCHFFSLPILRVIPLVLAFYYLYVAWKYRWSRKYYPLKTLLVVPIVKGVMDIGLDCGILLGLCKRS